ncbi:glycosyltransferase [Microbacterium candidum]|uniref:Spore protein YkvP/CgeB glycosyl transferase-like domain-containing protein n=1 Tax=Microbacterium candidum TaxID=3041922 RepID=A0ABT7N0U1_9MICO|nr:glycosyltransferase [Microbacterium sp. ASV49]MDL9980317.1 hypothetical protein [Microbacterium sp. ASV49]
MLTRLRRLWRSARALPGIRGVLLSADRLWWSRVIRGAGIVDLDYVAIQLNRRVSTRRAVRIYVRRGFRTGLSLNPLFAEGLVSAQLPDADRVPAMYAYLIGDPASVETSLAWDAIAYGTAHPESAHAAGGPLGHAWRALRDGDALALGLDGRTVEASHADLLTAARAATHPSTVADPEVPASSIVMLWSLDEADRDGAAIRPALRPLSETHSTLVLAIDLAPLDVRLAVAPLAFVDPRVRLAWTADEQRRLQNTLDERTVLVVRQPRAAISADSLIRLIDMAQSGPVAPLWVSTDGTVVSAGTRPRQGRMQRVLAGYPIEDARALGVTFRSATLDAPVTAVMVGDQRSPRVLLDAMVIAAPSDEWPQSVDASADDDGFSLPPVRGLVFDDGSDCRRVLSDVTLSDGTTLPRLRWAIKTAAPAGPRGESWGETHFARALAVALERLGQYVSIDARPAAARPTASLDDVHLVLRGPHALPAPRGGRSVLWIISHPDEITADEVAGFDLVFAASERWAGAASVKFQADVEPLLQCTDAHRFHPSGLQHGDDLVFVGTARGIARPSVVEPLRAGIPIRVYGPDWRGYIPPSAIAGTHVSNDELPRLYETAGAVLNDHWPAMRREGFVSNRLFDVVAAGGRAISDEVEGIADLFGCAVRTYSDVPELLRLVETPLESLFCPDIDLMEVSRRIREQHSFDARARALVDAVVGRSGEGRAGSR